MSSGSNHSQAQEGLLRGIPVKQPVNYLSFEKKPNFLGQGLFFFCTVFMQHLDSSDLVHHWVLQDTINIMTQSQTR